MTDATNVTQEARNAAWPFVPSNSVAGSDPAGFLSGLYDDCEAVKAFACFEEEVRTATEAASKAEIAELAQERDRALFELMSFPIARYLMANTNGRLDGAEKAARHLELSEILCGVVLGKGLYNFRAKMAVHDATQALTSYMDKEIGFPIYGKPDYDDLAPRFFKRFVELGRAALAKHQTEGEGDG